jgi:1-acyl-sn-glycerol-3-phosphate acyltransferase
MQPAVDAGCTVQPLVLRYLDRSGGISQAPAYVGDKTLWQTLHAIAAASGLSAEPHFLPPVSAAGTDRRHLAATLHRHISHALLSRERS